MMPAISTANVAIKGKIRSIIVHDDTRVLITMTADSISSGSGCNVSTDYNFAFQLDNTSVDKRKIFDFILAAYINNLTVNISDDGTCDVLSGVGDINYVEFIR